VTFSGVIIMVMVKKKKQNLLGFLMFTPLLMEEAYCTNYFP
jgi:hypothetical protein